MCVCVGRQRRGKGHCERSKKTDKVPFPHLARK
eukprot:jgi/Botrbrau1/9335/Bobra.0086s0019.1